MGKFKEAVKCHQYVIEKLHPKLQRLRHEENQAAWLILKDTEIHSWSHIFKSHKAACYWESWEEFLDELVGMVNRYQLQEGLTSALLPFDTLGIETSEAWRLLVAERHATQWEGLHSRLPSPQPKLVSGQPMRVGYLCYDYNDHPTTHLVEGLFYWHKAASNFEAIAFSYGKNDNSSYRERMEVLASEFVNIVAHGDDESVELIRNREVHIAVDMQAWTLGARVELLANRVAPIQVNYLIYPGTMGAPWIDYLIADQLVLPPENARHFSEHIVYLPGSYQVNYYERHLIEMEMLGFSPSRFVKGKQFSDFFHKEREKIKRENNLPAKAFVFCNFNKNDKLEPNAFKIWMAILKQVPGSVLWLLKPKDEAGGAIIRENLGAFADACGVSKTRIVYAERVPKANHLYRQLAADLFIDTFVYGAHSTATDALRSGLPILTLLGDSFPSRVGLSLLDKTDMNAKDIFVTYSVKDFESTAVSLATEKISVLFHARLQLFQDDYLQSRLFDTESYTLDLERSYTVMWEVYSYLQNKFYNLFIGKGQKKWFFT